MTDDLISEFKAHKAELLACRGFEPTATTALSPAARRQKVLAILARDGGQYATLVEDPNPDPVVMALATPDDGTCEVTIPKYRYDPLAILARMKAWQA